MQNVIRLILPSLLAVTMTSGAWAMEGSTGTASKAVEYKQSDTNFYWRGDVLKAYPSAVILAEGSYTRKDDSYFITPHKKAPKVLYIETLKDWIEPITPPSMPASLDVPPDAMQIREPQGDVQVALPSAPANFAPVTDGMTLPNGAVVKTGADGTAAVLFGGVDSARLIPNSAAAVQQTVTAQSRSAEVDLTTGGVFSKVGTQVGVKGAYEVHTPFGNAIAHGTDFVTLTTPARTDVWVAQGTVALEEPNSKKAAIATSDGAGPLKILRFPLIADPHQAMMADAETLTTLMNFIPMADQKIKGLRARMARGETLTTNEQNYLHRIKEVPCLIKLALVEPPAPPPAPKPAPAPAPSPAPIPAVPVITTPAPAPPPHLGPLTVVVHPNGTIKFQGATMGLAEFQAKLKAVITATPEQSFVIKAGQTVPYEKFKEVLDSCTAAQVKHVTVATPAPTPPTLKPSPSAVAPVLHPAISTPPTPSAPPVVSAPAPTPAVTTHPAPTPPAKLGPLTVVVHPNGTIKFQGATMGLAEFQAKLKAVVKATPDQSFVIKSGTKVPYAKLKEVLDSCADAQVQHVSVAAPAPVPPPPAPAPPAPSVKAPAPHLATSAQPMPPVPPPATSSGDMVPIEINLRPDGAVDLLGETMGLDELKSGLANIAETDPTQLIVIVGKENVTHDQLEKVVAICHEVKLKPKVLKAGEELMPSTVSPPSTTPASATPTSPAANLPTPGLLMHPSMESMSSNAPPVAPSGTPAPPTTNAPPPAGP